MGLVVSRRLVRCQMEHTPLAPHKNRIRRDWMSRVPRTKDIITISHGLLDVAMIMRWRGKIKICDIDPGVRETTEYLRTPSNPQRDHGDYPDLNILPPGQCIESTTWFYGMDNGGFKKLGAIDIDLACSIRPAWEITKPVLDVLIKNNYQGKVLITFTRRRDGFASDRLRLIWFKNKLPSSARYVSYTPYASTRIRQDGSRGKGSSMGIIELELRRTNKRK